jgi:dGTPase
VTDFLHRNRSVREEEERSRLAPAATLSVQSKGRLTAEEPDALRTCFEVDRDRIIHSKAFRRLAHKTQVFINPEGDHVVNRLTHTLKVARIGRSMAAALGLNEPLTEAICLGHDVGHAPFGHTGEEALSPYVDGEWLHSQQALRIYGVLEPVNLTWEVRDGLRSHSWKVHPPPMTAEGMLCRYADRIAYLTHDVADAIRAGIIEGSDLPEPAFTAFGDDWDRWNDKMILAVVEHTAEAGEVAMSADALEALFGLREFMFERVYLRPEAVEHSSRAIQVIRDLVNHYLEHPDEIPKSYRATGADPTTQVLDYVSGFTDRFALGIHDRLFRPEEIG